MTSIVASSCMEEHRGLEKKRSHLVSLVLAGMEATVLCLVCAAPWFFGAVHPGFEMLLRAGVAVVLVLWGIRILLEGRLSWKKCPVTLCLAGLFVLGIWQITPLSRPVLATVAPGTAALTDQLLPSRPEVVAGTEETEATTRQTISLYPEATRLQLLRLLAVFFLFAAVRNNLATEASLRRLSIVVLVNGAALSLFAILQLLSSPPTVLYWNYPSQGAVFGPFICRNHFPFYMNMGIGLGIGLLLSHQLRSHRKQRSRSQDGKGLPGLLRDPVSLWICVGLALMVGAVAVSLSRGGLLALGGAALVCLILKRFTATRSARGAGVLIVVTLAILLSSWIGFGLIQERLATLWEGKGLDSRLPLWSRMLPLAKSFPLWGTGYGTFSYTEGLRQLTAQDAQSVAEHAHNEFLEMLLEGGVVGLLLSLATVSLVFWLAFRALRRYQGRSGWGLILGALFGFTTLVVHSFGDFGLHIPAIALLATVLAAQLCAHAEITPGSASAAAPITEGQYTIRLGGAAPFLGAVTALVIAWILLSTGVRAHDVHRLRQASLRLSGEQGVACLEAAAQLAPRNADVQAELGRAQLRLFEQQVARSKQRNALAAVAGAVCAAHGDLPALLGWSLSATSEHMLSQKQHEKLAQEYFLPALRHYRKARNLCPLLSEPNLVLATNVTMLAQADSRDAYLDRVKLLSGGDPEAWYLCGIQELAQQPQRARASWRRCLELSDRYLPQILAVSSRDLEPDQIVEAILPDRPDLLVTAAYRLYPEASAAEERRPFLEKALRLLEHHSDLKPEELHVKAVACKSLGQLKEAIATYRQLLQQQPGKADWRFELAEVFYSLGQLEDARRELVVVLAQKPDHAKARELKAIVGHELARKR